MDLVLAESVGSAPRHRWLASAIAYLGGAVLGGLSWGGLVLLLSVLAAAGPIRAALLGLFIVGVALSVVQLARPETPIPGPRRQVSRQPLEQGHGARPGIMLHYGLQIGFGLVVLVRFPILYVVMAVASLAATSAAALASGVAIGLVRGLAPLHRAAGLRRDGTPRLAASVHRRLDTSSHRRRARWLSVVAVALAVAFLLH